MSTSAERLARRLQAQAKAAAAETRKRKAAQMEDGLDQFIRNFDATTKAINERHERDVETRNKVIQGDASWRKGQAICGSEEGLYPALSPTWSCFV